ncbi:olfactory receptor 1013-like [Spea bombifrons]|uniref:olfactory receptor 1013-like n=1 Tax=Spea bombifrons TaxID=233779 RepID=UPI00234978C1|nr:olfactory receptor 1013-like [Spea bombifrons]
MEAGNATWNFFILLGFYERPDMHVTLFAILLLIYVMALTGNLTIILVIFKERRLRTPMYFFLCNLSFLDITYTSTVVPKLLHICLTGDQSIPYAACIAQVFLFVLCVVAEYFLLAVMAYDRYAAICNPLIYPHLMNLNVCALLATASWCFGLLESFLFLGLISQCSFCQSKVINHLFCDLKPLIKLSCSRTDILELAVQVSAVLFGVVPLVFVLVSYVLIISAILRIRSREGKRKAFSTCSSHLTVVILFFGIILTMYLRPKSAYSIEQDKALALMYTLCIPTLNPVIYSLRNKEVKEALGRLKRNVLRCGGV